MSDEHVHTEDDRQLVEERPRIEASSASFRLGALIVALVAFIALFGYAVRERNLAEQLTGENQQTATALKDTRGQIDALNSKLDGIVNARQAAVTKEQAHVARAHAAVRHAKPDPRWAKVQSQLDSQGKAIDETRQDLVSTRTELQGSIATTHEELVALEKKGERNYFEFDLNKSKQFSRTGPVGISLRKANTKHQYADLELMVGDRDVSKKHLNLYEPAMFYPDDQHQPLELVINSIDKNHIHGYISAPKYRASELTAMSNNPEPQTANVQTASVPAASPQLRRR
jgi:hypothetical protein